MNHEKVDPHEPLEAAERLLQVADAETALQALTAFLRDRPGHLRARRLQARALLQLNRVGQALETLDIADTYLRTGEDEADPTERAEHLLLRSQAMGRLGRRDEAIVALESALEQRPDHIVALRRLVCLLYEMGNVDRAARLCTDLLELGGEEVSTLRLQARCYEAMDCADKALAIYQRLDRLEPKRHQSPVTLQTARLYHRTGRLIEAADAYAVLTRQSDDDVTLAVEAADLFTELGNDQRAMAYLEQAHRIRRDHTPALIRLAELTMRLGHFARAGRLGWGLWRQHGQTLHGAAGLMVCAYVAGRDKLANRCRSVLIEQFSAEQRQEQVTRLWRLAMRGRLLVDFFEQRAAETGGEVLPALLREAEQTIAEHLTEHANHADLHYHRAVARRGIGQPEAAARSFERALRINGGYLAAASQRIDLHLAERNFDTAELLIHSVRRHRAQADALEEWELAISILRDGPDAAAAALIERCDDAHRRGCLSEQAAEILTRHDQTETQRWIACCRKHPDLTEPFTWRDAA